MEMAGQLPGVTKVTYLYTPNGWASRHVNSIPIKPLRRHPRTARTLFWNLPLIRAQPSSALLPPGLGSFGRSLLNESAQWRMLAASEDPSV